MPDPEKTVRDEQREAQDKGAVMKDGDESTPNRMKIDLHCHTQYSWDCVTPIEAIPPRMIETGIRVQAITDHNNIEGALAARRLVQKEYPQLDIIVGEEVLTDEGEIIGLFLKEHIPRGLSAIETIARIRGQGGLVLLPHGFDPLKKLRLRPDVRNELRNQIDIIETFNARVNRDKWNQAAAHYAEESGAYQSSGSDAHTLRDIGGAWVEAPYMRIDTPADLLKALEGGVPVGKRVHPGISLLYRLFDAARGQLRRWGRQLQRAFN